MHAQQMVCKKGLPIQSTFRTKVKQFLMSPRFTYVKHLLQPLSSKVLNAVNRFMATVYLNFLKVLKRSNDLKFTIYKLP